MLNVKFINEALKLIGLVLVLGLCLFSASSLFLFNSFFGPIFQELLTAMRDSQTQLLIVLCACFYFMLFVLLQARQAVGRFWCVSNPTFWLLIAAFIGIFLYISDSADASKSMQALTFLSGATLSKGISSYLARQEHRKKAIWFTTNVVTGLLVVASFWHIDADHSYEYHSQARWTGPWDNPNVFGLLLGTGIVLAAGSIIPSFWRSIYNREWAYRRKQKVWKFFCVLLCSFAAILLMHGLLHSYSRGAWIVTIVGLIYLIAKLLSRHKTEESNASTEMSSGLCISRFFKWARQNWLILFIIILSVGVLVFWQFRHSKHELVTRRAFSTVNVNDFSWRNRIAAWEGALQITAEHPWLGADWNQPELLYEHYYLPPKLNESAAFQMNDYLMLGATLGIPALICFGMYIWLSLTRKLEVKSQKLEVEKLKIVDQKSEIQLDWPQTTCRAGTIVLAVGFWFDGGLFKLATASTFWILLELGRQDLPQRSTEFTNAEDLK